jgi:hypothetical protein
LNSLADGRWLKADGAGRMALDERSTMNDERGGFQVPGCKLQVEDFDLGTLNLDLWLMANAR